MPHEQPALETVNSTNAPSIEPDDVPGPVLTPQFPGGVNVEPIPGTLLVIDQLVKRYSYDGLGRLVQTRSPYPNPESATGERSERFYYDGIRRIQELITDPLVLTDGPVLNSLSPLSPSLDPEGPSTIPPNQTTPISNSVFAREYIWGPGDKGVDELLVQYDQSRTKPWWVIQDAGGDVVALAETPAGTGAQARVAAQWTYDAYGAVLTADHLYAHPWLHCGHKALFQDRLDLGVVNTGGTETPRLVPYAHSIYQIRNRAYSPALGRFYQRDPNETAMTLIAATAYHGRGLGALVAAFSMEGLYSNGANLYEYLGSNPWNRHDELGLSWDPFDLVDDYLAEDAGNKAAFMMSLGQGAKAAAVLAAQIATYLPFPAANIAGELALVALGEKTMEEAMISIGIGLIPGGKLLGWLGKGLASVGKFVGKLTGAVWRGALNYAGKAVRWLWGKVSGLLTRAADLLRRGCGCLEAGTDVLTWRGLIPIEQVEVGDYVVARDTDGAYSLQEVIRAFARKAAPIIAVTVMSASGVETFAASEEHPFLVATTGVAAAATTPSEEWVRADMLVPGSLLWTGAGEWASVMSVEYTGKQSRVYNIEVEGLHTYLVGKDGVVVHNGLPCFKPFTRPNFAHNLGLLLPKPGASYQAHHLIPHRFQHLFDRNLNDPTNGAWVHKDVHLGRGSITELWEDWARATPNATRQQVEAFAREVEEKAGLWMMKP